MLAENTMETQKMNFKWYIIIPFLILIILSVSMIFTIMPWGDEAYVANESFNLLAKGYLTNTLGISNGSFDNSVGTLSYSQVPLYFLAQALFFKMFGIGLFQIRFLSLLFGLLGLGAIYYILRKILKNNILIFFTLLLVSVNLYYVQSSSIARTDMMSSALSLIAFAVYLNLREKKFWLSILLSNIFICLSGLTHPVGIAGFFSLIFLILYLDQKKVNYKIVLIALIPYLLGGISWGLYIFRNLSIFTTQFGGRIKDPGEGNILTSIYGEFLYRYFLNSYGILPESFTLFNILKLVMKLLVIAFYFVNFILGAFLLKEKKTKAIWWILLIYFLVLMIIFWNKSAVYLVWINPLFLIILAFNYQIINKKKFFKIIYILFFVLIIFVSGMGVINIVQRNDYKNAYIADLDEFNNNYYKGGLIYGHSTIAFYYDFNDKILRDDSGLGYDTGVLADYIAVDTRYKILYSSSDDTNFKSYKEAKSYYPKEIRDYVNKTLNEKYIKLFEGKEFTFYKKK